jgi:hypothetical protein
MFDVIMGYISVRIFLAKRSIVKKLILGVIVGSLLCSALMYAWYGLGQPYLGLIKRPLISEKGQLQFPVKMNSQYKNLDFDNDFKANFADDYNVIQWLKEKEAGNQPVVLEANGDSYSDYERFSIHTGFPTIMGWYNHEWYWRGNKNTAARDSRVNEVSTVYTSSDINATKTILKKYNVKYIVIGKLERDKFKKINESKLLALGSMVKKSGETKLIQVNLEMLN